VSARVLALDDRLQEYLIAHSAREHPVLAALRDETRKQRYAGMQIGADQGALMALLVKLIGARRTIDKARDADTKALQALNDKLRADERVDVAMLSVGDGLTLARKR
jgi:predicted O-methyltransferase YrrM